VGDSNATVLFSIEARLTGGSKKTVEFSLWARSFLSGYFSRNGDLAFPLFRDFAFSALLASARAKLASRSSAAMSWGLVLGRGLVGIVSF
jgi:hypothetical protein